MHSHAEQYLELTQVPQQSPPSKLQPLMLVSSLQKPFPTLAFVILSVLPVLHLQSVQNSLLTQGPQQSPPIKRTMAIVVIVLAKTVPNQCSELAVYIWGMKQMFCWRKLSFWHFFRKKTLPPVMHPEIVSGMGIAKKCPFGAESSLSSIDIMQFLFEQVIE